MDDLGLAEPLVGRRRGVEIGCLECPPVPDHPPDSLGDRQQDIGRGGPVSEVHRDRLHLVDVRDEVGRREYTQRGLDVRTGPPQADEVMPRPHHDLVPSADDEVHGRHPEVGPEPHVPDEGAGVAIPRRNADANGAGREIAD